MQAAYELFHRPLSPYPCLAPPLRVGVHVCVWSGQRGTRGGVLLVTRNKQKNDSTKTRKGTASPLKKCEDCINVGEGNGHTRKREREATNKYLHNHTHTYNHTPTPIPTPTWAAKTRAQPRLHDPFCTQGVPLLHILLLLGVLLPHILLLRGALLLEPLHLLLHFAGSSEEAPLAGADELSGPFRKQLVPWGGDAHEVGAVAAVSKELGRVSVWCSMVPRGAVSERVTLGCQTFRYVV